MTFRTDVEPLVYGTIRASVCEGTRMYPLGQLRLSVATRGFFIPTRDAALALRDWLNRVLDSYPVKPKEPFFDPQVNPYAALSQQGRET